MDKKEIKREKKHIVKKYGKWTSHNIRLCDDVYTIGKRIVGDEGRLRRIMQIIVDCIPTPLGRLRILDLGCLEGLYAVELATHGAHVVGIEGREPNIEKARFAQKVLELDSLELVFDDVRNLSKQKYGTFDVVFCLGLLYHLNTPDVFHFMEQVGKVCRTLTIVDTHISLKPQEHYVYEGHTYRGSSYKEFKEDATAEEKAKDLWASLNNTTSFWFTRHSLYNLLANVGFTSVYECHNPPEIGIPEDRLTLVALKGTRSFLHIAPLENALPVENWPEI